LRKFTYSPANNKYTCWKEKCYSEFKRKKGLGVYDLQECPYCHTKVNNPEIDIEIDFDGCSKKALIEAFDIVLKSADLLKYGFDWVNDEKFESWFRKLSPKSRGEIYKYHYFNGKTIKKFIDYFNNNISEKKLMWKQMFERLPKKEKISFLNELENRQKYWSITSEILNKPKYDWSKFECKLKNTAGGSDLVHFMQSGWHELGIQVQDICKTNSEHGTLCPCLRASSTTSAYKCFWRYLENNQLPPDGYVPQKMLSEHQKI